MARRRKLVIALALLAAFTIAAVVGPWLAAALRGDLWVDTLGYEVVKEPGTAGNREREVAIRLDFFGSSEGGTARIEIETVLAGDKVVVQGPTLRSSHRSTFRVSSTRELDSCSAVLSIKPSEPAAPLPRFLVLKGLVEYRREIGAKPGKAPFSLQVDTVAARRNSVFQRTKLRFAAES